MNVCQVIESHPTDEVAVTSVSTGASMTYGELRERAAVVRSALAGEGVGIGDRVVLIGATTDSVIVALFGVWGVGATAVPLDARTPTLEVATEIAAVDARLVILCDAFASEAHNATTADAMELSALTAAHPSVSGGGSTIADVEGDHPALAMFTSGTAGEPKAAVLSHLNLLSNLAQIDAHPAQVANPGDVVLGILPFSHILGLNTQLVYSLHVGVTIVLVDQFDPVHLAGVIEKHKVTTVLGPPALWAALARTPGISAECFRSVRLALSGAAPLSADIRREVAEQFGLTLEEGYGLTEASPAVTLSVGTEAPAGSVGPALPGLEVRLVDERGADVLVGDAGEVLVRGPNVFSGYLNDPAATAAVLDADGWLHTGDLAVVDANGFLSIVGRHKDLVIVSGFNVYPTQVEQTIRGLDGVAAVAVTGRPHPVTGEEVVAHVVRATGAPAAVDPAQISEEDVLSWCRTRLAGYKCPTHVAFVSELPVSLTGKVRRRDL